MKPAVTFQQMGLICEARIPVLSLRSNSRLGILAVPVLLVQLVFRSEDPVCKTPSVIPSYKSNTSIFHSGRAIAAPFRFSGFPFCVAIRPRPKSVEPLPRVPI